MARVIQVRGVPDDVHSKLVDAAERAGKSLTAFVAEELQTIAERADLAEHNRQVILESQAEFIGVRISARETRRAIDEGRAERDRHLDEVFRARGR